MHCERITEDHLFSIDGAAHYPAEIVLFPTGKFIAAFSFFCLVISFMATFSENTSWDKNLDNVTKFLLENTEEIRNGTWNYSENTTLPVFAADIINPWISNMDKGMHRYTFGRSFNNFCWKRQIIFSELPSIFRASQLFATVQVPIRAGFLVNFTCRLFVLFTSLYDRSVYFGRKTIKFQTISFVVINELVLILSLFFLFTFHVWQDRKYLYILEVAAAAALISFSVKLIFLIAIQVRSAVAVIRIIFIALTLWISQAFLNNVRYFIKFVTCDQMVPASAAQMEYVFFATEFAAYLLDNFDAKNIGFFIYCDSEDCETYDPKF